MRSMRLVTLAAVMSLMAFCFAGCLDDGLGEAKKLRQTAVDASVELCAKNNASNKAKYGNAMLAYNTFYRGMNGYGQTHAVAPAELARVVVSVCPASKEATKSLLLYTAPR